MNDDLQRTEEWFAQRLGKLTASCIADIMAVGRYDDFTTTGYTYMRKKIAEILTGEREKISGAPLEWGTEQEPVAIAAYEKKTGFKVTDVGFVPLEGYEDYAGGSPDGVIDDGKGIIEVKCPWNSAGQVETLINKDFQEKSKKQYYAQIQFNMLCTGAEYCDFISFDPRMKKDEHKLFIRRYGRDERYLKEMKARLELAIEWMKGTGLV